MLDKINSPTPPPKEKQNTRYNKNLLLLTTTCKHVRHLGQSDFNSLATDQNKGIVVSLFVIFLFLFFLLVLSEAGFLYVWRGQCSTEVLLWRKKKEVKTQNFALDFDKTLVKQCSALHSPSQLPYFLNTLWITKRFKIRGIWYDSNLCTEIVQLCKQRNAMIIPEFPVHPASMFLYCARNLERHIKL